MKKTSFLKYLLSNKMVWSFMDYYLRPIKSLFLRYQKKTQQTVQEKSSQFTDKRLKTTLLILFFIALFIILLFLAVIFEVANPLDGSIYPVQIVNGETAYKIAKDLESKGIIKNHKIMVQMIIRLSLDKHIKAGDYEFSPRMSLAEIIYKLVKGKGKQKEYLSLTFPEGTSIYKMGKIIEKTGLAWSSEFSNLYQTRINNELIQKYAFLQNVKIDSLEGYLFPDTYFVESNASLEVLVDQMLSRFEQVVMPYWEKQNGKTKYSLNEIIILASIIEKEAANDEERPIISSVFHNRLKANMPLAADPTIKYALESPTKRVYLSDLNVKSPYNTYKNRGLPPGPISNPGIKSIQAAIEPAETDYYFFVARKDKTHIFTRNWQEHQKARIEAAK